MGAASYIQSSFLGGEVSQFGQGRIDRPDYRTFMNVCLNGFPVEMGAWVRRPGTRNAGHTRGGAAGKVVKFDFQSATPYTLEFTDGYLRFRSGATLIATNDAQVVLDVSTASPAVVQTTTAHGWATGNTVMFTAASQPLLQRRQFKITVTDSTHFSIADALTGAAIDGSTLGTFVSATVARLQEVATPYVGSLWSSVRAVQAETTAMLLHGSVAPQALTVPTLPTASANALFALAAAVFNDGPYLDPFTNGVQANPSAKVGIVSITLSFPAYSATTAYPSGAFVTSASVNYVSLVDQNVGNTPASSPTKWATTSAGAAINSGSGFSGSDVGRLVRLYSEPAAWVVGTTYAASTAAAPVVVSYNPSGVPGATTYWASLVASNVGHAPGSDLLNWQLVPQGAALWSWGKITSLSNVIDRTTGANLGDMSSGGGLAAAFDGTFSKADTACAEKTTTGGATAAGTIILLSSYVGKNYTAASDQAIQQATIYASNNQGFSFGTYSTGGFGTPVNTQFAASVTFNLRGKASVPSSASDGTLLGTSGLIANTTAAVTIVSSDQATAWKYVWVEMIASAPVQIGASSYSLTNGAAQVSLFNPPGTGTSTGVNVEIIGPALLYTTPINIWRLGVYGGATGYPTCGCYHEGRLWLAGAVANRFDACVSNGIVGGTINFAPTDQYGVVAASNALSYVLNSDGVNPIFWMLPDLQGIIMGTLAGEWLVQAPTSGGISPINIAARRVTRIGAANVEPRRTEHTAVFVQRYSVKLMEYFADVYSGKFSAPNLADRAPHITRAGISELAYQQAVTPIIWGRCADGSLFGVTYKRDTLSTAQGPTFAGWHRHTLGSGRTVESICIGPSTGGNLDSLTMVTNDAATGIRHVELLTDTLDEKAALAAAWLLDDAVQPSSTSSDLTATVAAPYGALTVNGLWHLNGAVATVFCAGLDCGDFAVSAGAISVPYGDSISGGTGSGLFTPVLAATAIAAGQLVIGFAYTSDGQIVRPALAAETGARSGPGFGKTRRSQRAAFQVVNTAGLSIGTDFAKLYPVLFKDAAGRSLAAGNVYSGVFRDELRDDYSFDGMLCWRITRPLPAAIALAGAFIHTQD